jgi:aspartate-semialdehyde dehydrogenase
MKMNHVAVVGASGAVGERMIRLLEERRFPLASIKFLASARSAGKSIKFRGEEHRIEELTTGAFDGVEIVLSSTPASISRQWSPIAASAGAVVVDNSSAFRMDPDVPLVVPEVNPDAIARYKKRNIIANPNCSTIQMVVALKPLHDLARIKRVVVSTYQSVSGAGKEAMDELFNQTRAIYTNASINRERFTKQIAFNCIPHIDVFMPDGSTKEEWKMQVETRKILDPDIAVSATCVRVPVFIGHAEAVNVEFENPISETEALGALRGAPGITVIDHRADEGYVTQIECAGEDSVFVSRLRADPTQPNTLSMWIVSDNLRKGAALNAVQIAEHLVKHELAI